MLNGNLKIYETSLKSDDTIHVKLSIKGGQDFYQIHSWMDRQEVDRRGGVLLKVAGQTNGNPGEAGTGEVIYHRNEKILET